MKRHVHRMLYARIHTEELIRAERKATLEDASWADGRASGGLSYAPASGSRWLSIFLSSTVDAFGGMLDGA